MHRQLTYIFLKNSHPRWLALLIISMSYFFSSCQNEVTLHPVSVADFRQFVQETGYRTDAEKYDWSVVQLNVYEFNVLYGIDWKCPDGTHYAPDNYPVTQVSLNDALAYCQWSGTRLPSYSEYWKLTKNDSRPIVQSAPNIFPLGQVNVVGNVWEITTTQRSDGQIRLAGGSYLCNKNTCNGTDENRELYVDSETGNTHISFAVIR